MLPNASVLSQLFFLRGTHRDTGLTRTALRKDRHLPFRNIPSHHPCNASLFPLETIYRTANTHATVPAIQEPATRAEKLIDRGRKRGSRGVWRKKKREREEERWKEKKLWNVDSNVTTVLEFLYFSKIKNIEFNTMYIYIYT